MSTTIYAMFSSGELTYAATSLPNLGRAFAKFVDENMGDDEADLGPITVERVVMFDDETETDGGSEDE